MRRFLFRIFNSFRPDRAEHELQREMNAHLALLEDEYVRRGMTPEEARLAARRSMGSAAHTADLHRDARSIAWLDDLRCDFRLALRGIARSRARAATGSHSGAITSRLQSYTSSSGSSTSRTAQL